MGATERWDGAVMANVLSQTGHSGVGYKTQRRTAVNVVVALTVNAVLRRSTEGAGLHRCALADVVRARIAPRLDGHARETTSAAQSKCNVVQGRFDTSCQDFRACSHSSQAKTPSPGPQSWTSDF